MTLKLGKRQHFTNCNARMQKLNALTRSLQINGWRTRLKTIVEKCPNWMALATSQRRNNLDYMYIFPFGRRGPSRFFDVFPSPSVRSDIDMYLENVKYAYLAIWQFDITFFLRAKHCCSLLCLFEKLESAFPEKDSKGAIEDIGHWALRREAVPLLHRVKAAVFVCGGFPKFLWSDCWELNLLVINAEAVNLPDNHLPAATQLKIQLSLRFLKSWWMKILGRIGTFKTCATSMPFQGKRSNVFCTRSVTNLWNSFVRCFDNF